ncbi:protein transport protein sec61 subunit gamma [Anaeramoeba flamelloides]|uniref:Protein transport protein sec61 subunit gamma n=1 Tax=Anaeramoeba flamelloides TaxID=1746091 RepID=A0AAV7Z4E8_9EUKA|nr:protein transport protein sec61 subunit gamma [Anaeramoeba flamelloides]KAJ3435513.1 protein transport protein sec61 subunit gamma [Anaeramoeba flamelloides]KAJ6247725.1 protein transport protein sec61 subunit gamma [Anaeramoeba flamelloides]KAJ6247773.1 protein transport protein sec61 subunit gamma [Anaeramoeba flamelloides]
MEKQISENIIQPLEQFYKESKSFFIKCTKPDRKEFKQVSLATLVGFAAMGIIGFLIKLIFLAINNILIGGG